MVVGLYFGSFNPIHFGHLAIAKYMLDYTKIEELWFVVSPQNPLKAKDILAPDYHRLELVKRAIPSNETRMRVCDIEMNMPKPSYTIDTLNILESKNPGVEFCLILGSDSMETITQWKGYKSIINSYNIIVYPRKGSNINELAKVYPLTLIDAPLVDYSSTLIRYKLSLGEDVGDFIPENVFNYIKECGLYQSECK